jgi:hypothetical protein
MNWTTGFRILAIVAIALFVLMALIYAFSQTLTPS